METSERKIIKGDAECIANVPRVAILKTTPERIQKLWERQKTKKACRGSVSSREIGNQSEEHGNYFRTVKPGREEGDASRHPRVKSYLAE